MLKKDPAPSLPRELNKLLDYIFKQHPESKAIYLWHACRNSFMLGFCGLPKNHKPSVPLCPIVDFTNSALWPSSNYLYKTLAPLGGKTSTHRCNAGHFVEHMKQVTVGSDECIVSFGIISPFASVPALAVSAA
ncbi:hypothetical protein HPB49_023713 [Dermacentor silvarum]|uniref:Uncharacterized protein n=1 Tax=Dermacentor silvarum TaxID=543639 RepID=A0ACB8CC56_DERSI|nr:hypothetical protein HPB49_023713 [Dermacentor silvarum]